MAAIAWQADPMGLQPGKVTVPAMVARRAHHRRHQLWYTYIQLERRQPRRAANRS
jgi:hypothetical protein